MFVKRLLEWATDNRSPEKFEVNTVKRGGQTIIEVKSQNDGYEVYELDGVIKVAFIDYQGDLDWVASPLDGDLVSLCWNKLLKAA